MPLGIKPTVDFAFKKIFGSPENSATLVGLLNALLQPDVSIRDVEILNPFSYQEFAADKRIVLDIRAHDESGRGLNIEMQVSLHAGLLQRLTYYACCLYTEQLHEGEKYAQLRPALSICLLNDVLFSESTQPHHRFQMIDLESRRLFSGGIEVHTVELPKYNLGADTIVQARPIEQWVFFLLHADRYEADELRRLLPAVEFQRAIGVIETIAEITEDKVMYDQREKAQRDYEWGLDSAREEGLKAGLEQGIEQGIEQGVAAGQIQVLQELLGEEKTPMSELRKLTVSELEPVLADLQQRLRKRDA